MALTDITRPMVLHALQEFDQLGKETMLEQYSSGSSGKSTRWYILFGSNRYDQKVVLRAAHKLGGLGSLPPGRGTFTASQAKRQLKKLSFEIVDGEQPDNWQEVGELISKLYKISGRLEKLFPGRKFTPDGHLVGSIGEVLAKYMFKLELLSNSHSTHDAVTADRKYVQIKLTQGNRGIALRTEPNYLLVLRLTPELKVEIVYNGKGELPWSHAGKRQSNGQRQITLNKLYEINKCISEKDRLDLYNVCNLTHNEDRLPEDDSDE